MNNILENIRKGMEVQDPSGQRIGTVEWVRLSDEDPSTPQAETVTPGIERQRTSLVDDLMEVFRNDSVPEVLQARLRREGFVRMDASGLFAADRYVLPHQIREVSGDTVILNVGRDDLVRR